MSIYAVPLAEWFPVPFKCEVDYGYKVCWHEAAVTCTRLNRCVECNSELEFHTVWGMHSIPWGHGWGDVWCPCCADNFGWR